MKFILLLLLLVPTLLFFGFKNGKQSDEHRIHEKLCEDIYLALLEEGIYAEISGLFPSSSIYQFEVTAQAFDRALYTFEEAEAFFWRLEKIISQTVNNNRECRPYLKTFPFQRAVSMNIIFFDPWSEEKVDFPKIRHLLGYYDGCRAVKCQSDKDIVFESPSEPEWYTSKSAKK